MDSVRALLNDGESLLVLLLVGLVAGWLAGQIVRGRGFGLLANLAIGVIGAFLGGWIFRVAGLATVTLLGQIIAATVGAVLLALLLNALRRR